MTRKELVAHLRRKAKEVGSQRKLARWLKVSTTHLNDVINLKRNPSTKLLKALGLKVVTRYE